MAVEVTVIMKDSERTMRHKFLCYEPVRMAVDDETIMGFIKTAKDSFPGIVEDVTVKASMVVQ